MSDDRRCWRIRDLRLAISRSPWRLSSIVIDLCAVSATATTPLLQPEGLDVSRRGVERVFERHPRKPRPRCPQAPRKGCTKRGSPGGVGQSHVHFIRSAEINKARVRPRRRLAPRGQFRHRLQVGPPDAKSSMTSGAPHQRRAPGVRLPARCALCVRARSPRVLTGAPMAMRLSPRRRGLSHGTMQLPYGSLDLSVSTTKGPAHSSHGLPHVAHVAGVRLQSNARYTNVAPSANCHSERGHSF